ncbi:hypothetical protein PV721_04325 [Streptomyces sp. MB09-01]|uniref:hypothetical protein n=1 Tax=Streptomyces sp. MB09-01 TaxID=3028666 RepID=UPI0029BBA681|nr:hypothetical protein [Streptomyces sp. MB09-01]MDX3533601.1 hypothetical protein [Streptomyces sp. MB09-01]
MPKVLRSLVVLMSALTLAFVAAGPASAASWGSPNLSGSRACSAKQYHRGTPTVAMYACYVLVPNSRTQVVMIVGNGGGRAVPIGGEITTMDGSRDTCPNTHLSAKKSTACYARATELNCNYLHGTVTLRINGVSHTMRTPKFNAGDGC